MDVVIHPATETELRAVSAAIAGWQAEPTMHICYVAESAEAIASDLAALEPVGLEAALVALRDDRVVGFMAAEWDEDPPRVWWHGPFVDPTVSSCDELADVLYQRLRLSLPRTVTQEELAVDDRHATIAGFADRNGFERIEDASAVFVLEGAVTALPGPPGIDVSTIGEGDRHRVAMLHDALFPGTHSTGERIASAEHHAVVLVARLHRDPVGYIACERQADGTGYIDYLGVAESHRGSGIGRTLVLEAVAALRSLHCEPIVLTVRESNVGARRLYRSIGFTEERLLRPWRKGF